MRTQWEFSCTEVPGGNIAALLKHLQVLGDDGWEPFHMQYIVIIEGAPGKMLVFSKRPLIEEGVSGVQQ